MSYGDNEYGSTPYGDDSILQVIVRLIRDLAALFFSPFQKGTLFTSVKESDFSSPDKVAVFMSMEEPSSFVYNAPKESLLSSIPVTKNKGIFYSARKIWLFISNRES